MQLKPTTVTLAQKLRFFVAFIATNVAWLNPFTSGPSENWSQQLVAIVALALVFLSLGFARVPMKLSWIFCAFALLITLAKGSYATPALLGVLALILLWLAVCLGAKIREHTESKKVLLLGIACAAIISALQGLFQYLGLVGDLWPWVINPLERGIAYGALRQTNLFATLLVCGVLALIWLHSLGVITLKMTCFLVALVHMGSAASASRVGLIEIVAVTAMTLVWHDKMNRSLKQLLIAQALIYGVCLTLVSMLAELHGIESPRLLSERLMLHQFKNGRQVLWSNMLDLIALRPWLGWGWGELGYAHYISHFPVRFNVLLDNAHNLPLHLAVEMGLPIAIIFVGLILWFLWRNKPWSEQNIDRQFAWLILFIIGIHSMVEFPLWNTGFIFLTGIAIGLVYPLVLSSVSSDKKQPTGFIYSICLAFIVFAGIATYQYQNIIKAYEYSSRLQPVMKKSAIKLAEHSWLFLAQVDFVKLSVVTIDTKNALQTRLLAERLLHFSAEPRVIEPLLMSLWLLQDKKSIAQHLPHFCEAFPQEFERWMNTSEGKLISNSIERRCSQ